MNVKFAGYADALPNSVVLILPDDTVWAANDAPFRKLQMSDLQRLRGYESPAYRRLLMNADHEVFPFVYYQYGLEKDGIEMVDFLTLSDYAEHVGKAPRSVRQKCQLGTLPGAVKFGRDWMIPSASPYEDHRKAENRLR